MAGRLLPFRRQRADADDAYTSDDSFATSDLLGSRSMGWTGSSVSTSEVGDADYQILGGVRPDSADNFLAWDPAYAFNGAGDDGVYFFSARDPATNTVACNVSGCSRRIVIGPGQARSAVQRVLYAHWSARHSPAARMKDAARKAVEAKLKGVAKIDDVEEWVKEIAVRPRCKEPGYKPEEEAAGSEADPDKARCIDSDVYFFSAADEEGRSRCLHEGCPAVIAWRHAGVRGQPLQPLRRHWERFHSATTTKSCAREAKARHEAAAFAAAATLEDVTDWYPRRAVAPKDWAPTPAAPVGYYFAAPDAEGYLRCLHPGCGVRLSGADKSNLKKHWVRRHSPAAMPKRTKRVRAGTGLTPAQKKHEIATSASAADFTEWHPSRAYRPDPAAPGAYFFGPPQRDGTVECAVPGCTSKLVLGHLGNLEKHWIRMHLLRPAASETTSPAAAPTFTPLPGVTVTPPPGATQTAAPHHPALQHRLSPLPVKAARDGSAAAAAPAPAAPAPAASAPAASAPAAPAPAAPAPGPAALLPAATRDEVPVGFAQPAPIFTPLPLPYLPPPQAVEAAPHDAETPAAAAPAGGVQKRGRPDSGALEPDRKRRKEAAGSAEADAGGAPQTTPAAELTQSVQDDAAPRAAAEAAASGMEGNEAAPETDTFVWSWRAYAASLQ